MKTIFVQIASYRDRECAWTIRDLYAKARHPERVSVGLCGQYDPEAEPECAPPEEFAAQIRQSQIHWRSARGVCWARMQTQKLYRGEDFTLVIDSHMRFAPHWDAGLIDELGRCAASKPLLSNHPAPYLPPNQCDLTMLPTTLVVPGFGAGGELRVHGTPRTHRVDLPTRGAFVAAGFIFAAGAMIGAVPYDPFLYFNQEEIALAVRLFTHGWDVYSPSEVFLFHYYTPAGGGRPMHWDDHADWAVRDRRATARLHHLLGMEASTDPEVLLDLDRYGLGSDRSLADFERFAGIDFRHRRIDHRAKSGGFAHSQAVRESPNVDAVRRLRDQGKFLDIDATAPQDVLVAHGFLDRVTCENLVRRADARPSSILGVVDAANPTGDGFASVTDERRNTESVDIEGWGEELTPIFGAVFRTVLNRFYDVEFEWYERPQLLRYRAGGRYDQHADADHWMAETQEWVRLHDRDFSVLLYLNDGFEGGELAICDGRFIVNPRPGTLVAFPSDRRFLHAARPTTAGTRYVLVSWAAVIGSPRVRPRPPFGSLLLGGRSGPGAQS